MKVFFMSLGCDKNLADSEHMLGLLQSKGYEITDNEYLADAIIINTCCFIGDAKEESINAIIEMGKRKEDGNCKALIVAGCLGQRYHSQMHEELPEVDAIIGTTALDDVASVLESCFNNPKADNDCIRNIDDISGVDLPRTISSGGHYGYLKISEGCDKHCTYCIIPKVRGKYRSFDMEKLLNEAKEMASNGVKELILVAQETTMYGVDIYGKKMLHILLKKLCEIDGFNWIRILYCYPEEIYDELIEVMAVEKKICHYLDMPVQHANNDILKRMGRRTTKEDILETINKLRKRIPDITLRTTLITGFPGEDDNAHREVMDFVKEAKFDRLGVFTYSPEEDTPAALFENQIDEGTKENRKYEIMELQHSLVEEKSATLIGKEFDVIIEGKILDEYAYIGRTYMDIPGVDSNVFINTDENLMTGDFVRVKISGFWEYDLIGELI